MLYIEHFFERIANYLHEEILATFRLSLDQSNEECLHAIQLANQNNEFFAHMVCGICIYGV